MSTKDRLSQGAHEPGPVIQGINLPQQNVLDIFNDLHDIHNNMPDLAEPTLGTLTDATLGFGSGKSFGDRCDIDSWWNAWNVLDNERGEGYN